METTASGLSYIPVVALYNGVEHTSFFVRGIAKVSGKNLQGDPVLVVGVTSAIGDAMFKDFARSGIQGMPYNDQTVTFRIDASKKAFKRCWHRPPGHSKAVEAPLETAMQEGKCYRVMLNLWGKASLKRGTFTPGLSEVAVIKETSASLPDADAVSGASIADLGASFESLWT